MKIVRFLGGLGNQMFQYAFYKSLAQKNTTVFADLSLFENYTLHNGYELKRIFNIDVKNVPNFYLELLKPNQTKWVFKRLKRILSLKKSYREESTYFEYDNSFLDPNGHHYYWGYWQNVKYFKNIRPILLEDFKFPPLIDSNNTDILAEISTTQSISIHIRRGDYLNDAELGNICDASYYLKAITYMEQELQNPVFYLFSDDVAWCKENIKAEKIRYINWNTGQKSYVDMYLMSQCKHNIIANSSFSWWGAWLNQNPEKFVIAPLKWMKNTKLSLALDEWIKI